MGLSRRGSSRGEAPIWPGFVDAMTSLLMVLIFVLTIFMIVQFVLRETITTQDSQLSQLNVQVSGLAEALGLEKKKAKELSGALAAAQQKADEQDTLISSLNTQLAAVRGDLDTAKGQITAFQAQVAGLLSDRAAAQKANDDLTAKLGDITAQRDALQLAVAKARKEVDARAEAARLAAARADALQALIASLRKQAASKDAALADLSDQKARAQDRLSAAEKQRLADAAAARLLRDKLKTSQDALTAMTLALEEQRKKAEDTLTLLAAAQASAKDLKAQLAAQQDKTKTQLTDAEKQAALLAVANKALDAEQAKSADALRKVALLNAQIAALRGQLGRLQGLLDAAAERDSKSKVQIQSLGNQLNAALAQVAMENQARLKAEEAARKAAEEKAKSLEQYRSEFFGKLRQVLKGQPGVRIVGDRFVFSSEVLFQSASADLSPAGKTQIADVTQTLKTIAAEIPPGINWILEVDGFTDDVPLTPGGKYADNWALSQARALSVVHYMIDSLGFPPDHLAAAGFGQYQPVASGSTPEARAQNRRIELKLTER